MIPAATIGPVAAISWAIASTWSLEPLVVLPLCVAAGLYLLGIHRLRLRQPSRGWKKARSVSFFTGIGVLFVALSSPIDAYSDRLLSVHMVQHLLLMQVACPFLLLGRPITLAL